MREIKRELAEGERVTELVVEVDDVKVGVEVTVNYLGQGKAHVWAWPPVEVPNGLVETLEFLRVDSDALAAELFALTVLTMRHPAGDKRVADRVARVKELGFDWVFPQEEQTLKQHLERVSRRLLDGAERLAGGTDAELDAAVRAYLAVRG